MTAITSSFRTLLMVALTGCLASETGFQVNPVAEELPPVIEVPAHEADQTASLWNLPIQQCAFEARPLETLWTRDAALPESPIFAASAATGSLAVASPSGTVELWTHAYQASNRAPQQEFDMNVNGGIESLSFSSDGTYLMVGGTDGRVRVLDAESGLEISQSPSMGASVGALAGTYTPMDIRTAFTSGPRIHMWFSFMNGSAVSFSLPPALDDVAAMGFWGSTSHLVVGGELDGEAAVAFYPVGADPVVESIPVMGTVETVQVLEDGQLLVTGLGEQGGFLALGDVDLAGSVSFESIQLQDTYTDAVFDLDGAIATFGDEQLTLWSTDSLDALGTFEFDGAIYASVDAANDTALVMFSDGRQELYRCAE